MMRSQCPRVSILFGRCHFIQPCQTFSSLSESFSLSYFCIYIHIFLTSLIIHSCSLYPRPLSLTLSFEFRTLFLLLHAFGEILYLFTSAPAVVIAAHFHSLLYVVCVYSICIPEPSKNDIFFIFHSNTFRTHT